jgi:hypothetical protein
MKKDKTMQMAKSPKGQRKPGYRGVRGIDYMK